jgi:hypothetical protein
VVHLVDPSFEEQNNGGGSLSNYQIQLTVSNFHPTINSLFAFEVFLVRLHQFCRPCKMRPKFHQLSESFPRSAEKKNTLIFWGSLGLDLKLTFEARNMEEQAKPM